jgi:hypothetical protein
MSHSQLLSANAIPLERTRPDRRYLIAGEIIAVCALAGVPYRFVAIFAPGLLSAMGGKQAMLGLLFTAASIGCLIGGLAGGFLSIEEKQGLQGGYAQSISNAGPAHGMGPRSQGGTSMV